MLPIELPTLDNNFRLLQLPAPPPQCDKRPTAPSPSSGYIIAVG